MFVIRCENCGAEQRWSEGVTLGQDTVIEVAERAVYCECGNGVEEKAGKLNKVSSEYEQVKNIFPS
ncbi:hypothetical protein [Alicyclobacillus fastidiosus]|uniref:Uncharacterized protein n=1 Tax=Alicyclobacillus fastidiosus TaxID=392011 RepID=A0ABV5AHH9_9BACL|nr:hypothetical protein [Alicyclobacillus fastidiosus]WEH09176.1 hypothetical protein PYS47_21290 [Alicyclobacillus fastidiosus]